MGSTRVPGLSKHRQTRGGRRLGPKGLRTQLSRPLGCNTMSYKGIGFRKFRSLGFLGL